MEQGTAGSVGEVGTKFENDGTCSEDRTPIGN